MRKKRLWRPPPRRAYEPRDPKITSVMMSAVRNRENKAEVRLRKELWRRGYKYRLYNKALPGRPDIVFSAARLVVFVDGDFWHGRAILENGERAFRATLRTKRRDWWVRKLKGNIRRDRSINSALRSLGWRVVRIWESKILADVIGPADRVERALHKRRRRAP